MRSDDDYCLRGSLSCKSSRGSISFEEDLALVVVTRSGNAFILLKSLSLEGICCTSEVIFGFCQGSYRGRLEEHPFMRNRSEI